ncbi:MAG: SPASM domain-containing protein, partial [Clostridiaceae bacterium]|nr:SPASM domain-containing protein [Clostridiaceae bacterium]
GYLYPCHQLVDNPDFRMGSLQEGITRTDLAEAFSKCNVFARPECQTCWARYYCSGGCAANAYHVSGDLLGIDAYGCELFRKRMECALMIKAAETLGEPSL